MLEFVGFHDFNYRIDAVPPLFAHLVNEPTPPRPTSAQVTLPQPRQHRLPHARFTAIRDPAAAPVGPEPAPDAVNRVADAITGQWTLY